MSKESTLNKEQRKVWQKALVLTISRERRGIKLSAEEKVCLDWLKRYKSLMKEKLEIIKPFTKNK